MFSKDHKQIDLDGENILIHLSKLKRELPVKSTLCNYPFSYFFDPYKVLSDTKNMQRDLQIIADQMVEYLLLPKKIKIILTDKMDASGKYMDLGEYKNIFINSNIRQQNLKQKVATLAHEMTHYYLFHHRVNYLAEIQNELLTDLSAVYLGFGDLMFSGYEPHVSSQTAGDTTYTYTAIIGYINPETILRAIILSAKTRRQQPLQVISKISYLHNRWFARLHLHVAVKEYRKAMKAKNVRVKELPLLRLAGWLEEVFNLSKHFSLRNRGRNNTKVS